MAVEILTTGGFADGELTIDETIATLWVGGQPAYQTAAGGLSVNLGSSNAQVALTIGVFKNTRAVDEAGEIQLNDANINQVGGPATVNSTILCGQQKLRFFTDGKGTGLGIPNLVNPIPAGGNVLDTAPFQFPPTANAGVWLINDEIFINATGFWNNAAQNGGDKAFGRVIKPPATATDDMVVDFYGLRSTN